MAVVVGILVFGFRLLSNSGFANDHYVHLARAQQMLLGSWPVRDFVDPGLPLMYAVSAGALLLFGHSMLGEAIVVFLAFAVAAGLTLWLAWKSGVPMIWALMAVAFQVLMMPRSYSYPKILIYAVAIAFCWRLIERPSAGRAWAMAVVAVVAFLFRHDHGLFVGAAGLVAILGAGGARRLRLAGIYGVACLTLIAPWALYVQASLGLDRYARSTIAFSRAEAELSVGSWPAFTFDRREGLWQPDTGAGEPPPIIYVRWRPGLTDAAIAERERALGLERIELHEGRTWRYHPDVTRLDDILADPAVEDTNHLDAARPHWWHALSPARWRLGGPGAGLHVEENSRAFLYYLFLLLPLGMLAAAAFAPPGARTRIVVVALLALMVDFAFLRDPLEARLPDVVMPQALLLAWLFAWGCGRVPHAGPLRRIAVPAATVVLLCLMATAVNAVGNVAEQFNRVGGLRPAELVARLQEARAGLRAELEPQLMPSRAGGALIPVLEYLQACTGPADRFSYIGFGPDLYFYADRGFGGGQVAWLSTYYSSDEEQRLTRDRLAAERVPIIIIPEDEVSWFREVFPIVAAHVDARYRQIADVSLGDRRGLVLADSTIPATGTYAALGWPCFT